MTEERLNDGLSLININISGQISEQEIIQIFAERSPIILQLQLLNWTKTQ